MGHSFRVHAARFGCPQVLRTLLFLDEPSEQVRVLRGDGSTVFHPYSSKLFKHLKFRKCKEVPTAARMSVTAGLSELPKLELLIGDRFTVFNHPVLFSVFPTLMAEFRNETVLLLLSAQELALKCKAKAQNIRA